MNGVIWKFLKNNNVVPEVISFKRLHKLSDIDPIVSNFAIYKREVVQDVSVGNVVGIEGLDAKNLLDAINMLYGGNTTYATRADEYLDKSKEEMIKAAKFSTIGNDKPCFNGLNEHCYILSENGRHRFTALAVLYCDELSKGVSKEELDKKYSINARVSYLDYLKTYGNYIIHIATDGEYSLSNEYDEDYRITGRSNIRKYNGEIVGVYDDKELLEAIRLTYKEEKDKFKNVYNTNDNFRKFVENVLRIKEDKNVR